MTKSYTVQNVSRAEVEKPCSKDDASKDREKPDFEEQF